jgi:hypothetical protein
MYKKIVLVLFFMIMAIFALSAKDFEKSDLPKNLLVVSQSGDSTGIFIAAIDLDNNELVIIVVVVNGDYRCFRTGMICDPDMQKSIAGISAPFQQ